MFLLLVLLLLLLLLLILLLLLLLLLVLLLLLLLLLLHNSTQLGQDIWKLTEYPRCILDSAVQLSIGQRRFAST